MNVVTQDETLQRPGYRLSRSLFLRLLAAVYLVAFVSLYVQIDGLIGSRGILPAADYLNAVHQQLGRDSYWRLPTLFWLHCSDLALSFVCVTGILLSLLLLFGVAPIPVLLLLWASYLSLTCVGQVFLGYQWDTLLLETGFCALFYAPATLWPRQQHERAPSAWGRWLLWCLLFKLMFLSGATKLLSGDETWRDLTALTVHYETQPLPNAVSWYAHQLPDWVQKASVVLMLVIELAVPFLIFVPRYGRRIACALLIGLQIGIALTGNYGFFNLLAIVLCVTLLDDGMISRIMPKSRRDRLETSIVENAADRLMFDRRRLPVAIVLFFSALTFVEEMVKTGRLERLPRPVAGVLDVCKSFQLRWGDPYFLKWARPFRTINGYGLFRVMTVKRPEIVVEGSRDGHKWVEYSYRWKPGDVRRRPGFAAPHQPRLDWQMWFAALDPDRSEYWLRPFLQRLAEGSPEVLSLLGDNPFPDEPPRYVRLVYYRYEFTNFETKRMTGRWWTRTHLGNLTTPFSFDRE